MSRVKVQPAASIIVDAVGGVAVNWLAVAKKETNGQI
jgi:hypothetical protein